MLLILAKPHLSRPMSQLYHLLRWADPCLFIAFCTTHHGGHFILHCGIFKNIWHPPGLTLDKVISDLHSMIPNLILGCIVFLSISTLMLKCGWARAQSPFQVTLTRVYLRSTLDLSLLPFYFFKDFHYCEVGALVFISSCVCPN